MPSTYTTNTGIEKPGSGEQSGTWGTTVNTNMDILDRALNGVVSIALSGTSSTLTTTDGLLSDGMYKLLVLGGSPSGTHTITVAPADAQKIYFVRNASGQSVVFTQGSGAATVTVLNGTSAIIYADGSDECRSLSEAFALSQLYLNGTAVTATASELNTLDGITASTAELNIMDGVTASTAELNIMDGVTATTAELNTLDGITATVTELNYTDGVTSNIQTQLNSKANLSGANFTGAVDVNAALTANSFVLDNGSSDWSFEVSSNVLYIKYAGVNKAKLDTSGNLTVTGNVTAYGSV